MGLGLKKPFRLVVVVAAGPRVRIGMMRMIEVGGDRI